jgi:predicted alpha/beta-hydrolase family hydrolase
LPGGEAKDREGIARALESVRALVKGRVFAGGHSYGGRMTTMLAAEQTIPAAALLLLSYPLHPPKKPEQMRTAHFPQLRTPSLFVHGSTDGFGSIDELTLALKLIPARTDLLPIPSSGHDLKNAPKLFPQIDQRLRGLNP